MKPGAVVLDVGINVREKATEQRKHKLVGDVNFGDVSGVASALTPVPGGEHQHSHFSLVAQSCICMRWPTAARKLV